MESALFDLPDGNLRNRIEHPGGQMPAKVGQAATQMCQQAKLLT